MWTNLGVIWKLYIQSKSLTINKARTDLVELSFKEAFSTKTYAVPTQPVITFTDTLSEVEEGEQVFTMRRQDGICLVACNMPYGNFPSNTVFKVTTYILWQW